MKLLIFLSITSLVFLFPKENKNASTRGNIQFPNEDLIKIKAFKILEKNCNVCHLKKNKKRVFTLKNMNKFGKKINRQVFKWKRMPKGEKHNLTKEEYRQLKVWITSIKKK